MKSPFYIAVFLVTVCSAASSSLLGAECQTVEGQIVLWNGWPPWIRIESNDKKNVFGIESDEGATTPDYMPDDLSKALSTKGSLSGTFCVTLTGEQTSVPYDDRVIKYVKVVTYKIK